jgi:hypothetical protein
MDYIESLQDAIRMAYGCRSKHIEPVPVVETVQGQTIWDGMVEVFELIGHPSAKLAYAWGHAAHDSGNEVRIVTILAVPPVDSPSKAVQVSIAADADAGKAQK